MKKQKLNSTDVNCEAICLIMCMEDSCPSIYLPIYQVMTCAQEHVNQYQSP